jgi:hypothetical protein
MAVLSADGFGSPSGGVAEGDLISSGITANAQTSGGQGFGENVNFYQLEDTLSTEVGGVVWTIKLGFPKKLPNLAFD